jgi:hypothetical protein
MFVLSQKAYDFLKNLVQHVLPGGGTLYFTFAEIWDLPGSEKVIASSAAVATFLGIILKISSTTYDKLGLAFDGEMIVEEGEDGATIRLALNEDSEAIMLKDSVSFRKVVKRDRPLEAAPPQG